MTYDLPTKLPHGADGIAGKTVLVTGGAGAIGGRLAATLSRHCNVVVLDDLTSGHLRNIPEGVNFINGSILEPSSLRSALSFGPSVLFHHAALFANQNSVEHPEGDLMVNGLGTLRVLDAALEAGVNSIVYASSSCVYGASPGRLLESLAPGHLETPYAISKYAGEQYAQYLSDTERAEAARIVTVRYFNVYGPGELPGQYRNVTPNFVRCALRGESLVVTGTGDERRDFTFIDDAVAGTILAATRGEPGGVYNLGTGTATTIRDLANLIVERTGSTSDVRFAPQRAWDSITERCADVSAAVDSLGYSPTTTMADGLEPTIKWLTTMRDCGVFE